jgi:hypothetical protein
MSPERTVEERFGIEKAVEWGVILERNRRGLAARYNWEQLREIHKARRLNPAYVPVLDRDEVRSGDAGLRLRKEYSTHGYQDRPMRDLGWLRFFPDFEEVSLNEVEIEDYSPLTALLNLRKLSLNDAQTTDLRPVGQCSALEQLAVRVQQPWVKVDGLERLERLQVVQWNGSPLNLQAIPRWPAVRRAALRGGYGLDFPLRDAFQLPEMPLLEDMELESIFSLDGLDRYPRLVTLKVAGAFRDVTPLTSCRALTHLWLELSIHLHLDVLRDASPLARLPELHYLHVRSQRPRDYGALVEAPRLHEIELMTCLSEPLQACAMEQATLNATLEPWDTEFLAPAPRPLPPLHVAFVNPKKQERVPDPKPLPGPLPAWEEDRGFRKSEFRWLARRLQARLFTLLDRDEHWGEVETYLSQSSSVLDPLQGRCISVVIKSQEGAERLREIIELLRAELGRLCRPWQVWLRVDLELPPVNDPRVMAEIERLREEANDEDRARKQKEEAEFLERQHRLQLQKEGGGKIRPADFAAPGSETEPAEEEDTGRTAQDELKELFEQFEPDRPHPLSDQYNLQAYIQEADVWSFVHYREAVEWLLGPEPKP